MLVTIDGEELIHTETGKPVEIATDNRGQIKVKAGRLFLNQDHNRLIIEPVEEHAVFDTVEDAKMAVVMRYMETE